MWIDLLVDKTVPLLAATLALGFAVADAGSVTGTATITIQAPLGVLFTPPNPSILCNALAGSLVTAISVTGGSGSPATYALTGGDTTDFAVNGANVVVGPNGIAAANCGKTNNITITATQP